MIVENLALEVFQRVRAAGPGGDKGVGGSAIGTMQVYTYRDGQLHGLHSCSLFSVPSDQNTCTTARESPGRDGCMIRMSWILTLELIQ